MKYIIIVIMIAINFNSFAACRSQTIVHRFNIKHSYRFTPKGYVVDHICALACGGLDITDNMQYQTILDSKIKDRWELTPEGCFKTCNQGNSTPIRTVFNCKP